jgi:methionine sulfoxide reductase heme-binding subunit
VTTPVKPPKQNIDTWSTATIPVVRTRRATVMLWVLGAPALLPIIFEMPGIVQGLVTGNGNTIHSSGNDVFGTGGALLLFAMLSITPIRTLTRRQWFVPLRRWYGIVFAVNIFLDAATATNDPEFNGAVAARLTNHTFELMGVTMTIILIPLFIQGVWNKWSMKRLGKYWKPFQKYGTYAIWFLLGCHLLLLEGFGTEHADAIGPDSPVYRVLHQRFYDYLGCTVLMILLRLPPVRRWVRAKQNAGKTWQVWLTISPAVILFGIAYVIFINELFYKGISAMQLNPIND